MLNFCAMPPDPANGYDPASGAYGYHQAEMPPSHEMGASMDLLGESLAEKGQSAMRNLTPLWWGAGAAGIFVAIIWGRK